RRRRRAAGWGASGPRRGGATPRPSDSRSPVRARTARARGARRGPLSALPQARRRRGVARLSFPTARAMLSHCPHVAGERAVMEKRRVFSWVSTIALLVAAACVPATSVPLAGDGAGGDGQGKDAGDPGEGGAGVDEPDERDAGVDPDAACAEEGAEASLIREPVDIVFVVDNSASLRPQIERLQQVINADFAKVLDDARLDYRVIVISEHGDYRTSTNSPICIEAPLSGIPAGGCASPPAEPSDNPPKFFHYSYRIRT